MRIRNRFQQRLPGGNLGTWALCDEWEPLRTSSSWLESDCVPGRKVPLGQKEQLQILPPRKAQRQDDRAGGLAMNPAVKRTTPLS